MSGRLIATAAWLALLAAFGGGARPTRAQAQQQQWQQPSQQQQWQQWQQQRQQQQQQAYPQQQQPYPQQQQPYPQQQWQAPPGGQPYPQQQWQATPQRKADWAEGGTEEEDDDTSEFHAWLAVGLGMTQRAVEHATIQGQSTLDTGFVPAAELLLRAGTSGSQLGLGVELLYQTSLWTVATQEEPNRVGLSTDMRSHRFVGGLLPSIRFGSSEDAVELSLLAAYGLRSLYTVEPLLVPSYTLHGPLAQLRLAVPIAGVVVLGVAPEAQFIASITDALQEAGNIEGSGFAWGVEGSVRVMVVDWVTLELRYRESHASAGSIWDTPFTDAERYVFVDTLLRWF